MTELQRQINKAEKQFKELKKTIKELETGEKKHLYNLIDCLDEAGAQIGSFTIMADNTKPAVLEISIELTPPDAIYVSKALRERCK